MKHLNFTKFNVKTFKLKIQLLSQNFKCFVTTLNFQCKYIAVYHIAI